MPFLSRFFPLVFKSSALTCIYVGQTNIKIKDIKWNNKINNAHYLVNANKD